MRALALVLLVLLALAYRQAYYSTTSLTIGERSLDWYAYRGFSSRAHFILFIPMFDLERRRGLIDPGYMLQPTYPGF